MPSVHRGQLVDAQRLRLDDVEAVQHAQLAREGDREFDPDRRQRMARPEVVVGQGI